MSSGVECCRLSNERYGVGVPEEHQRPFSHITDWRAFYILTDKTAFSDLPTYENVVVYYRSEWQRLREYATAIGPAAQFPVP